MANIQTTIGALLKAEPDEIGTDEVGTMKAMLVHLVSCIEDMQECMGFALGQLAQVIHRNSNNGQALDRQNEKHQHRCLAKWSFQMHEALLQEHDKKIQDIQAMLGRLRSSFAYFVSKDLPYDDTASSDDIASRVVDLRSACAIDASVVDLNMNAQATEAQHSDRGAPDSPSPSDFVDHSDDFAGSQDALPQLDHNSCTRCHLVLGEKPQLISFPSPRDAQLGGSISWQDDEVILAEL